LFSGSLANTTLASTPVAPADLRGEAMAQLTKGARVVLDHLDANLADIQRLASELTLAELKNNPYLTQDILTEISALAKRSLHLVNTDLEPLLQRQERRVDGVEISERFAALEQMIRTLVHNQS